MHIWALSLWIHSAAVPLYWSQDHQLMVISRQHIIALDQQLRPQWQLPLHTPANRPFAHGPWVGWLESDVREAQHFVLYNRKQKRYWRKTGILGYSFDPQQNYLFLRDQSYLYRLHLPDLKYQRIAMLPQQHQDWVGSELIHHPDGSLLYVNLMRDQYETSPPGYASYPQIWSLSPHYRHKTRVFKQWGFSSDYGIQGLSVSPDGQWLAFYAGIMGTFHLQHLPSGRVTRPLPETGVTAECAASAVDPPLWASNSRALYLLPTAANCPGLVGLRLAGQRLKAYPDYPSLRYAVLSPDQRWLAGLRPQKNEGWQPWIVKAPALSDEP